MNVRAGLAQNSLRDTKAEEERLRQDLIAQARRESVQDLLPTAVSPQELKLQEAADEAEALRTGATLRRKNGPKGRGLLGSLIAWGADKATGDKKQAGYTEQARTRLTQARELGNMASERTNLDKALALKSKRDFDISEREAGQLYDTGVIEAEDIQDRVELGELQTYEQEQRDELQTYEQEQRDEQRRYDEEQARQQNAYGGSYREQRMTDSAGIMTDSRKSATTAIKDRRSLNRFLAASGEGREGGAAPMLSGMQNFLTSFGISGEGLEDVAVMEQGVANIKANYMEQLGARGLTDRDMDILAEALPRMATSKAARDAIANVLQKENTEKIYSYLDLLEREQKQYPGLKTLLPNWVEDARNSSGYMARKAREEIARRQNAWQ